ncbi:unnamed protein product [Lactuca saligna]|uniref:Uncharacterized protein n=1 Tax=Lactuca saligna TaxID=75948 RepID=A0AA35VE94_LACSI|nr:unnamed protein product [Lactuca saligna]
MTDDADEFPFVAHIPDAMLRRFDPTNVVLVAYLKNIDHTVQTGILLPREEKKFKCSKKNEPVSSKKLVTNTNSKSPKKKPSKVKKPVVTEVSVDVTILIEPVVEDTQDKVVIPSKNGVFRRIKMKSKHTRKSPTLNVVRKPHVTHQGLIIREIPTLVSPSSKKRMAEDMAKQISQREKKKTRKLVMATESTEDEDERIPETW